MNILKCILLMMIFVYGELTTCGADATNIVKAKHGDSDVVAQSKGFEGLYVKLHYEQRHRGCITNGMLIAEVCREDPNSTRPDDFVAPPHGQCLLLSLKDELGALIPLKRSAGFRSPEPTLSWFSISGHAYQPIHGCPRQIDMFCLDDIYTIKQSGTYELEASPRFYKKITHSDPLVLITNFPTVKIWIHLNRNDGN
jgi:hypothetical protein